MRRGAGCPSALANASPTCGGSTGSCSAHSISTGRSSPRSASSTRRPSAAPGRVRRLRDQARERARARLRGDVGERRVVGGGDLVAGIAVAAAAHEQPARQVLGALDEGVERLPGVAHALLAGEQAGVHEHEAADAVRVLDREPQPDRAAPVVDDERGVAHVEVLEQRGGERDVAVVGVPVAVHRLVRAAEARQVGQDHAVAGVAHRRQHVAPQVAPRRLAVPHHHRPAVALVDVRHAQAVDGAVVGLVGEVRQPLEQLVGCADGVGHPGGSTRSSRGSRASPSGAAVTWMAPGSRTQAIASSTCRRSSTNWNASAWRFER